MAGEFAALLSAICYALSYMFLRKGQAESKTDELDNGLFSVLLISSTVLLLFLIVKVFIAPASLMLSGHDWKVSIGFCVLSGLFGTLLGRLALYATITRIGATRGVIINSMAPIVTLIIAVTVLNEKFNISDMYGMVLLTTGMILLSIESVLIPYRFLRRFFHQAVLLGILASLLQGIGHTFRKVGVDTSIAAPLAATVDTLSALLVYIFLLSIFGRFRSVFTISRTAQNINIVLSGLFSAAAVLLFFDASDSIPVSHVSMITSIQPVIVALLSALFMEKLERLTWITLVSSIIVTFGVVLMSV